ncbi:MULTISPECIES: DUF1284 domain-containing protein [unclassified Brucella]|uniref:DUF1284 domain-containing protein n=2 Tax=Brucella TaxID=234 RepID=UPI0012ADCD29|nr:MULTISPECIES: DUF1284 domain-containing protein [unclassified Brucella]MRN59313.1 DUF1284 domain-containing protein [Brucella sp. 09RB8918]CAB4325054.1 2Fe-2S ferredoxin [Brucella sp. 191011898]
MTVRLRGHHLLCMLTYIGKGYSPAFVENYDAIAGRLSEGEDILLVDGPDDICTPLLCGGDCHCHDESVTLRDRHAIEAVSHLLQISLYAGKPFHLGTERLTHLRKAFTAGTIRKACEHCEWSTLCTRIAATDAYAGVKITMG